MKIWQWDDRKSITLTRYVVVLAILASAVAAVCGPWLVTWLMNTHHLRASGPAVGAALLDAPAAELVAVEAAVVELLEEPQAARTPAADTAPAAFRKLRREIMFFIVLLLFLCLV